MRRLFSVFVFVVIAGSAVYIFRAPLSVFVTQMYGEVLPCSRPLTYSIGVVDSRFNISQSQLETSLKSAAAIWNAAAGHVVLEYAPEGGTVKVNTVYDDRQKTTVKLKSLGYSISSDKASYDTVQAQYNKLQGAYLAEKAELERENAVFARDAAAYESEVSKANARGGATPAEYQRLQSEKAALLSRQNTLSAMVARVNADADDVNSMVTTLNRLASIVNADASTYNSTAKTNGEEFEEAVFESSAGKEEINVYEYDSEQRLTRVLAHEFGHALGLDHVDDPDAIMYRLNQSSNQKPTQADIVELHRVCRTQS